MLPALRHRIFNRGANFPRLGAVTTAPNQAVVIQEWNATAPTTINWGDGSTTVVPANTGTTISHTYAAAGTYTILLGVSPLAVTRMDFRHVALRIYSVWLKVCVNTTYFRCSDAPQGVINSADMAAWRPTYWYCYSLPAGMLPLTVAAADFSAWTTTTNLSIQGNSLTQAQVDAVLQGLYASFATRTVANGTINVAGNNAAPSGTYQAHCPPVAGKEWAYELTHDSCNVNPTKKWLTVTTN